MATRTISASGGTRNWSDTATWDEGVVPTAADDVVPRGDGTSGNVTIDTGATRACRSMDLGANYTGTISGTQSLSVGTSTAGPGNVALKLAAGMGWTHTGSVSYVGTNATAQTLTMAGKSFGGVLNVNGAGGTLKLLDTAQSTIFKLTNGTFDLNGQSYTASSTSSTTTTIMNNANTKVLAFGSGGTYNSNGTFTCQSGLSNFSTTGSGTLNFLATTQDVTLQDTNWSGTSNGITMVAAGTGTFTITTSGTATIGNLTRTGGGTTISTGSLTVGGNCSITVTAAKTLTIPAGQTLTVTGTLTLTGAAGQLLTVKSSSAGSAATISKASGTPTLDYLSVQDITASGGATFTATHSTNVSGNTGIGFTYEKTGGAIATGEAGGPSAVSHTYEKTGGAIATGEAGGVKAVTYAETGGATATGEAGGVSANVHNYTKTGGAATTPAVGGTATVTNTPTPTPTPDLNRFGPYTAVTSERLGIIHARRGGAVLRCRVGGRGEQARDLVAIERDRLVALRRQIRDEDELLELGLL